MMVINVYNELRFVQEVILLFKNLFTHSSGWF